MNKILYIFIDLKYYDKYIYIHIGYILYIITIQN